MAGHPRPIQSDREADIWQDGLGEVFVPTEDMYQEFDIAQEWVGKVINEWDTRPPIWRDGLIMTLKGVPNEGSAFESQLCLVDVLSTIFSLQS